jgi:acyl-CoA thioester hydrolase
MTSQFPAVVKLPVQWGDQDLFGHVNNTVYFRWFESSRVTYWYESGLQSLMQPSGLGPILASVKCDYKKQIRYPDTVHIGARILKMGLSSVTLQHEVFSDNHQAVAAVGQSVIVLFNYEKQHPVPIEGEIRKAFLDFDSFEQASS